VEEEVAPANAWKETGGGGRGSPQILLGGGGGCSTNSVEDRGQ